MLSSLQITLFKHYAVLVFGFTYVGTVSSLIFILSFCFQSGLLDTVHSNNLQENNYNRKVYINILVSTYTWLAQNLQQQKGALISLFIPSIVFSSGILQHKRKLSFLLTLDKVCNKHFLVTPLKQKNM